VWVDAGSLRIGARSRRESEMKPPDDAHPVAKEGKICFLLATNSD